MRVARVTALEGWWGAVMNKEDLKAAYKEAVKEWLDSQFAEVGKWTVRTLLVAAIGAVIYFVLIMNGWKR
jgi:hypothetical protein